jgi:phenylalanyl-tRNA synthetase beta chain
MTISYNWLKQYIDIPETAEEIGKILTSTGLEVEKVERFESVKGGLGGLVIGEVLTCEKHPNADKLSITQVDVGTHQARIVCGAPNVAAGQKVVVALPGTTVYPSKGEPFMIRTAKIRGEQSEGMICAEDEIGLGQSHAGIMVLSTDAKNGTPASEFFQVESDYTLEIGLTPNRADAASHLGVARDIKAAKKRKISWPSVDHFRSGRKLNIPVVVENIEACPRYSAVTISGVRVKSSPEWLKNRLKSIGLTPINNIVDITNFVLHETGQPLHAFDADKIKGQKVIVKTLAGGTRFTTLDNKERLLHATDLMICNGDEEGMCIAGVFGGLQSGISDGTVNIFLESACFSPQYIRRTSMNHQLKTDASFRFERGTDPNLTVYALKRAALLIVELAGGEVASEIVDVYPAEVPRRHISVKDKNVDRLIGKKIPRDEIFSILELLDIQVTSKNEKGYDVSVPPYRVDVVQEADVVEEILRIYGFNNIELSDTARTDFLAEFPVKSFDKYKRSLGELLTSNGFYEIWTNSLTNLAYQQKLNLQFRGEPVEILNKLSEEQGVLRQNMLFTGLEVCAYNINRKQKDLKLYEFGKIYYRENKQYKEEERLVLYMTGNVETENWQRKNALVSYFDIAQHVSNILAKCGVTKTKQEIVSDPLFEYAARLMVNEREIARIGKVKSLILKDFGIRQELFHAELNTSLLFNQANPKLVIEDVPKFPEVRRDLSLVLDSPVRFDEIHELVMNTERKLVKEVIAFDVYEGENIPKGKKAYALSFTLQDESKTLTDQEIDKTMERLMDAFEKRLGAVIRK